MIKEIYEKSKQYTQIDNELFIKFRVKKGLRNEDGTGVCVGLTKISDVVGYHFDENGCKKSQKGDLFYRGVSVKDLVYQFGCEQYGFEKISYLLLFGFMPSNNEFQEYLQYLYENEKVSPQFLNNSIWALPTKNIMNKLQQIVLMLYSEDEQPDAIQPFDFLCKGISLLSKLPMLIMHAYYSQFTNFLDLSKVKDEQLKLSCAQQLLYYLRKDHSYTKKEADVLDIMLILHADHGGGNNSTFTNVVISSSETDIYSTISGAIGSMKGLRHGGANIQVSHMMNQIISDFGLTNDIDIIKDVQRKILKKEYFDQTGLIYGMGHAVYTLSDPRSEILQEFAKELAVEKGLEATFNFYQLFEQCAKDVLCKEKGMLISSNIDFYSGFVYQMLGIPEELYTPIFVCARTIGWIAHTIENKEYDGRIMRPATKYVGY